MNIQTSRAAWVIRPRVPVSPIPLHRRRDTAHIFIGIECGLREAGFTPTVDNLARFLSCRASHIPSLRKRLKAWGLMEGEAERMFPSAYGLTILRQHRGDSDDTPPRPDRDIVLEASVKGGRPHGRIKKIEAGQAHHVARRFEGLGLIKAAPEITMAELSRQMGYSAKRASDGARHVLATLEGLGLVSSTHGLASDSTGRAIQAALYTITDAGRAKLAARQEAEE